MSTDIPQRWHYRAGYIDKHDGEYRVVFNDEDRDDFAVRLCAVKIENRVQNEAVFIKLALVPDARTDPSDGWAHESEQKVEYQEYELVGQNGPQTNYTGAWLFVSGAGELQVFVSEDGQYGSHPTGTRTLEIIADEVSVSGARATARSGTGAVYCCAGQLKFKVQSPRLTRYEVTKADGTQSSSGPIQAGPVDIDSEDSELRLFETGSETPKATLPIVHVDGSRVVIGPDGTTEPFAVTPRHDSGPGSWTVTIDNQSGSSIKVWLENGQGSFNESTGQWDPPAEGTTTIDHGTSDDVVFWEVPDSNQPNKQLSIHWTSGDDPKVLVRRPTQLGTGRGG